MTQLAHTPTQYCEPVATNGDNSALLTVGPLEVYADEELARVDGRAVVVSGHAFGLLVALARRPGEVVPRDVLYSEVWGGTLQPRDRSVDVILVKLRGALEQAGPGWRFIHTHQRRGYRLAPEPRSQRVAPAAAAVVPQMPGTRVVVGPVEIVPTDLLVIVDGHQSFVRPRDMEVLMLLGTNAGRVLSRAAIFEAIWKRPLDPRDRSVDVAVRHLRSGLAEIAPGWDFFHTHFRRGYRFEPVVRARRGGGSRVARTPGTSSSRLSGG